jgi:hypothetical protein
MAVVKAPASKKLTNKWLSDTMQIVLDRHSKELIDNEQLVIEMFEISRVLQMIVRGEI